MRFIFFANSPGEIYAWMRPVAAAIKERHAEAEIVVINPPCQWRSGQEGKVSAGLPWVDRVVGPALYLKYIFFPRSLSWIGDDRDTVIIYMGGESIYPLLLKRRTGFPLLAYEYAGRHWTEAFDIFFVSSSQVADALRLQGIDDSRIEITGDLMLDSVRPEMEDPRRTWGIAPGERVISLCPGSRPYELKYFAPFLLRVAEILSAKIGGLRFFLALSPFTTLQDLASYIGSFKDDYIEGTTGRIFQGDGLPAINTDNGLRVEIIVGKQHDLMDIADLMITIPGTKTMEAASMGTPMVVIAPLNKAEEIVISGPFGMLSMIPLVGKPLKRVIVKRLAVRYPYTALPNMRAGRYVVPEVRGIICALQVAERAAGLLGDPDEMQRLSAELQAVAGRGGAAVRIAEAAFAALDKEALPAGLTG